MLEEFGLDNDTKIEFFNYILELGYLIFLTTLDKYKFKKFIVSKTNKKYFYLLENNNYLNLTAFKKEFIDFDPKVPSKIIKHPDEYYININIEYYPNIRFYKNGLIYDYDREFDSILIGKYSSCNQYKELEDEYLKLYQDYKKLKYWLRKRTKGKLVMTSMCEGRMYPTFIKVTDKMEKLIDEKGYLFRW